MSIRTTPDTPATNSTVTGSRLRGIDVARAIAVVGMVMVHFGPRPPPHTVLGNLYAVSYGRASVLFVLLAGVGVALLAGLRSHDRRPARRPAYTRGRLVLRGALLLPIGLGLQILGDEVYVILQYYTLYFLLAALVLTLPDRWLLTGAIAVIVVGPIIYLSGEMVAPGWYADDFASLDDPPGTLAGEVAIQLLLTGAYPLVIWAAPLLFGLWIGRQDLAASRVRWQLIVLGLAVAGAVALAARGARAVLGEHHGHPTFLAHLLTGEPFSQMPLWMLGSMGSACAVLGVTLLLTDLLPRATWPLVATGQLALTVYVGHLLLLAYNAELVMREGVQAAFLTVGTFVLLSAAASTLWRAVFARGPLEAALAAPWWPIERVVRQRARKRRGSRLRSALSRRPSSNSTQLRFEDSFSRPYLRLGPPRHDGWSSGISTPHVGHQRASGLGRERSSPQ